MKYTKLEKVFLPTVWVFSAILEWREPQESRRILEAKWFTAKRILIRILVPLIAGLTVLRFLDKTFAPSPFELIALLLLMMVIDALLFRFGPSIIQVSSTGITRFTCDGRKRWNFRRLQNYSFEHLETKSKIFTILVLRSKKGKLSRIAINDSIDLNELERILIEHGIPKIENSAETVLKE